MTNTPSLIDNEFQLNKAIPNVVHLPITTRKGRVVYNRKPHLFTENDVLHISKLAFLTEQDT